MTLILFRLNLPGKLVDSEKEVHKVIFNADEGAFIVTCIKQVCGEYFDGLDMLTDLLTPKGKSQVDKPLIEILGEGNFLLFLSLEIIVFNGLRNYYRILKFQFVGDWVLVFHYPDHLLEVLKCHP